MNVVFIHQNFPGQFRHIAGALAAEPANHVLSISQPQAPGLPGVRNITYRPARKVTREIHPYLISTEAGILNGQSVARVLLTLKRRGFVPDVVVAHAGWGEALFVKDVLPDTRLIGFFEFFYRSTGADVNFDPEYPTDLDGILRLRTRTAIHLLALEAADVGITPTHWQKSVFPAEYHHKLHVIHEGIDTDRITPLAGCTLALPDGHTLTDRDEVVTYVARNLEPYRGFHIFMRAVEHICRRRPNAHVVIVGGDDVSYGQHLPDGESYRKRLLKEVTIDPTRVHFLGRIPYEQYLTVLRVSTAHVYLTIPFVLSWSMLEAMAAGCTVIGSDTPPVREVIRHEENGLLVNFQNPEAVADAVDYTLSSKGQASALRIAARGSVLTHYSVTEGIERYRMLLGEQRSDSALTPG